MPLLYVSTVSAFFRSTILRFVSDNDTINTGTSILEDPRFSPKHMFLLPDSWHAKVYLPRRGNTLKIYKVLVLRSRRGFIFNGIPKISVGITILAKPLDAA